MTELLITVFLLLAAENALFSILLKNNNFMTYSSKCGSPFLQAFCAGLFVALPFIVSPYVSETNSVAFDVAVSALCSAILVFYKWFVKKDEEWYLSLAIVINSGVCAWLSASVTSDMIGESLTIRAVVCGIAVAFGVLCFCGVKENFCRRKRSIPMLCIYSVSLIALAIMAFIGFAV